MNKKHYLISVLVLVLFIQPFLVTNSTNGFLQTDINDNRNDTSTDNYIVKKDIGAGGEEQLITNVVRNGGFEETSPNGGPEYFNYYGSAYQYTDTAYTSITHGGSSYSCSIQGLATEQFYANPYVYRSFTYGSERAYLQENIEFDFFYYLLSNPDVSTGGEIYLRLRMRHDASSTYYYLYYYFSSNNIPSSNSTGSTGYYDLTSSFGSWESFSRDITTDFNLAIGAAPADTYVQNMYIYATSPANPLGMTEVIVDDFSLENGSFFNYIPSNGDFELGTGSGWSGYNRGIASIYQTDEHTEGNKAINMTAYSPMSTLTGDAYIESYWGDWSTPPRGYYVTGPGSLTVSFDWKYNDVNGGSQTYAFFYIYGWNYTYSIFAGWFFGSGTDTIPWSNYTDVDSADVYYSATGFGERDVWHAFNLDVYDLCVEYNITNMPFIYTGISINAINIADTKVELLIDDFKTNTYPTVDPSFEENWDYTVSNPIPSWETNYPDPYVSFTSDANVGDTAANITSFGSVGNVRLYRDMYLKIEPNLFTDFWWKLEEVDSTEGNYALINIETDDGKEIYYILGASELYFQTNSTNDFYYYVDDFNQSGIWHNLVRNIANDFVTAFGEGNWNITGIEFHCYAWGASVTSLIVDDVHFVLDSTGPRLISQILLNDPTYYQDALLEIMAVDSLTRVVSVRVFYRTETTWSYVIASMFGMYFRATIPAQDFGNTIEYYFEMSDLFGKIGIDDNSGAYYSYDIIDDIDPTVNILSVSTNAEYGIASINLDCDDAGSGIEFVEILDNGTFVATVNNTPYVYDWDPSVRQESGLHVVTVIAHDYAGNTAEASFDIYVTVYEPPGAFVSFFHKWGTLVGAGIVGVAWASYTIVQLIRKPK